ncbi:putative SGNH/GDSL hydrolase family protein [Paenibacillus sp. 598K]|uniref:hypothetical protein n=1 Tax=Paenibacillus sp. 598K TaxID=1117987 RepID=UPI000FF9FC7F|nr:hypothetical protein [Paenibacillus sp. 598K]GBF73224.1 putative SGNH/GDSL hydrolase family protein [Paenibacillus sp. 598K]
MANYAPRTGKVIRSDGSIVNEADGINPDGSINVRSAAEDSVGHETLTLNSMAAGLASIPEGATKAALTVEDNAARYWLDGSNPTVTAGHKLDPGDRLSLDSRSQVDKFRAIAVSGSSRLQVSYFGVPSDGPDPGPVKVMALVASSEKNTGFRATAAAGLIAEGGATYRDSFIFEYDTENPRFIFSNYNLQNPGPNPITIKMAAKINGIFHSFSFGGNTTTTVAPGATVVSDPIAASVAKGQVVVVQALVTVETGQTWPTSGWTMPHVPGKTDNTAIDFPDTPASVGFGPIGCLGDISEDDKVPSIALIGSSSVMGTGDLSGQGFARRSVEGKYPYIRFGSAGYTARSFVLGSLTQLAFFQEYTDAALIDLSSNDVESGRTLQQIKDDLMTIFTELHNRGLKVYMCTQRHRTNSTDNWNTLENQTFPDAAKYGPGSVMDELNIWIKTNPAPLTGYFDICDILQDPVTRKWRTSITGENITGDGTHMRTNGAIAVSTSGIINFT